MGRRTISAINISDDSNVEKDNPNVREAAVTVGPKAGTIGKLTFGNNQLGELKKTKLSGGSFNEIWAANHQPVKLGDLLVSGYALQYEDGSYEQYTKTLQNESIYNVKVVKCPHAKINEDGHCAYCNATGFVAQVTAADGSSSAYTDIAAAIAAADGGTVKLLANAGEITISSPLKLDLNGKTAAKLTVTGDVTLASLLPEGYAFKSGSTWISDLSSTELTNVSMAKIPIKSMDYPTEMSMTYGGAGTLLVNVKKETGTGAVSFQWYKVENGKETAVGGATTSNQFNLSTQKLSAGNHTFRFSATCDGYKKMSQDIAVTVQKADIRSNLITPPTAQGDLTYTGQEQALITAGSVADYYGTMQYSLTENGTYSQDIPVGTDAGAYTVWYRVIGDANHNDTEPASVAVSIGKKPLTITGVTAASKPYDGTTNADISSVTFDNMTLNRGTDYTVTASFDDASVGNGKNITATVTLMEQAAKNYALEQSSFPTTGSIIKAAAPDFTKETALTIVNGHEKTYTVTLPALPTLETPKAYGALTYEIGEIKLNDGYYTSGAKVENGKLTLPIQKNDVETTGSVGTVTVVIKSANYEDITLTVNVSAKNRITPTGTPTLSKNAITYGDALNTIALSGKLHDNVNNKNVEGMFMWADGTVKPSAGSYEAAWKFTPTDGGTYAETTGTVTITVNKAKPTGDPIYTRITAAKKTLKDAALTIEGSTLKPNAGELEWVDDEGNVLPNDTTVDANKTYKWRFTPTDGNYTVLTGSIELYHRSSGGGGSYTPSYTVSVDKTENGTITVSPKSASKGDTVTITVKPDKGYEPDTLKVLDQNGDKVKLTEKDGKYTFKMPDSKVEIQATFVKETEISPFGDVSTDAYYYEAVKWAQKKGITGGIGNDLFGPNQPCIRAQIATFLWRAAGSPEPKNMSSFSDVPTDSYYAKAVAWAVENGITTGTGDGKFSPNAPCTRAQSVTFLYRASGSPAVSDSAVFADVEANAFYADAVAWAVTNGVTNGTTSSTFSPDNGCTRAQIVTFLYRAFNK